jgi:hypothetical protein
LKGSIENEHIQELQQGIKQIQSYLLGTPYRIEEARLSAAKAAFVATAIRSHAEMINLGSLRYADSMIHEIGKAALHGRFSILNKLKPTPPETFYYWSLISRMEK